MALSISNESKNTLSITNEKKPTGGTFGDSDTRTFADGGTFGEPGTHLENESKNTLIINNEAKN